MRPHSVYLATKSALKALCLLFAAVSFAACDLSSTTQVSTVQHMPDKETWMYKRNGEYYTISHEITPQGSRISYYYCLRSPLEEQNIVKGELEIPTQNKQVKNETVGNLKITVWYDIAGGVMLGVREIPGKPLSFSRVGRVIGSKEDFKSAIRKANETRAWGSSSYEGLDDNGTTEGPFPITSDMETIVVPLDKVVVIEDKTRELEPRKKEVLIVFTNPSENQETKLNRKIYQWRSIERVDGREYRLISQGTNELYEGDFTSKRIEGRRLEHYKMTIDVDGLSFPWSFQSDAMAGYIYYDAEDFVIRITEAHTFDEYLTGDEEIE